MKNTGIIKKIEALIIQELDALNAKIDDEVWQYRDEHFLNGSFDYLFLKYILDNKTKIKIT